MPDENPTSGKKRRLSGAEVDEAKLERWRQRAQEFLKHCEENPLPRITDEDRIKSAGEELRRHMGIGEKRPPTTAVLFFIEVAPSSSRRGAACQFVTCNDRIKEGDYRTAVHPGMNNYYGSPDYYHVRCFEKLVDFSQAVYVDRVTPITRNTVKFRGLRGTAIADGNYLVDGGAERLILEWKVLMGGLIDRRDGAPAEPLEPDFDDLLHKAGSASYKPKKIASMTDFEHLNLSHSLAPIESDGAEDQQEWNLFEQYLPLTFDDLEDLDDRHSLSDMLDHWKHDTLLANIDENKLNDIGREAKEKLGKKALRALQRLSSTPMPDFQSAFLRGLS